MRSTNAICGIVVSPRDERPAAIDRFVGDNTDAGLRVLVDPQTYLHAIGEVPLEKHAENEIGIERLSWGLPAQDVTDHVDRILRFNERIGTTEILSPTCVQLFNDDWSGLSLSFARTTLDRSSFPVHVSMFVREAGFDDWSSAEDWLDEATALDAQGFYVSVARERGTDAYPFNFVDSRVGGLLRMVHRLRMNDYEVLYGYSDIEGLLVAAVGATGIASGWSYKLRAFAESKWQPQDGGSPPKRRIFIPDLLTPVLEDELRLMRDAGLGALIPAAYAPIAAGGAISQPDSQLSFLRGMSQAISDLEQVPEADRLDSADCMIRSALDLLRRIRKDVVVLQPTYVTRLESALSALHHFRGVERV